jgi:translation initiation factor 2A
MPGIAAMQLATAPGSHVAGFVPEAKVWLIKFLWLV